MNDAGWSDQTRQRWFYLALAASTLGVVVLFWPFAYVLLFAATTVVVAWPVYERVLRRCRGRRGVAAAVTVALLALVVFGPLGTLIWMFVQESVLVVEQGVQWFSSEAFEASLLAARDEQLPAVADRFAEYLPEDFDPLAAILEPLRSGLLSTLNAVGGAMPKLVGGVVTLSIDAVIYVFAVFTLFAEGPRALGVLRNLSPMEDAHEEHLFRVFREFANNMVMGSLATASLQGVVAAVGYAAVGVDRVVFLGICTGVCSFVPLVGTLVIWLPVCLYVGATEGIGWGLGLAAWNLAVTGSVDNVVKPLFLRGRTNIHPLLIFLAVFGGLYWMSLPGVLVGPVIVAFFLALYTIYCQDQLGIDVGDVRGVGEPLLLERVLGWIDPRREPARPEPVAPVEPPIAVDPSERSTPQDAIAQDDGAQIAFELTPVARSEPGSPPRTLAQGPQGDKP